MKTRDILECTVTTKEGRVFSNPLMLSELHILGQLHRENKSVKVERITIDEEHFKQIF